MIYPEDPGYSVPGASKEAAASVRAYAGRLRAAVYAELVLAYPEGLTRDEIALRLDAPPYSVGPRLSELHFATVRMIEQTGEKRSGLSGRKMAVWRAFEGGER